MKKRFANLLSIKSIVTINMCAIFTYLCIIGKIQPNDFIVLFTVIIGFYFGTQSNKKSGDT